MATDSWYSRLLWFGIRSMGTGRFGIQCRCQSVLKGTRIYLMSYLVRSWKSKSHKCCYHCMRHSLLHKVYKLHIGLMSLEFLLGIH